MIPLTRQYIEKSLLNLKVKKSYIVTVWTSGRKASYFSYGVRVENNRTGEAKVVLNGTYDRSHGHNVRVRLSDMLREARKQIREKKLR